jgi:hypothetical protein
LNNKILDYAELEAGGFITAEGNIRVMIVVRPTNLFGKVASLEFMHVQKIMQLTEDNKTTKDLDRQIKALEPEMQCKQQKKYARKKSSNGSVA